jgi:uncharacterized membrane protein YhiD involved in acid resistance
MISWIIGNAGMFIAGVVAILMALLGIQTKRVSTQKEKVSKTKAQLEYEKARVKRQQKVADTKDAILQKQKQQVKIKEENVVKIQKTEDLPHEEKIEEQQKIINNVTDLFNSRNTAK